MADLEAMRASVDPMDDLIDQEEALSNLHGVEMRSAVIAQGSPYRRNLIYIQNALILL